ncbi:acetylornithine transaminase [Cellulomonas sp. zg-Y766]|uniref:Acetylornithine aminotransferase n=1 Tax=Cellulomonas wangsupingiae TaxID=2968085 RepID=A0ABY5K9P8_9CELL|nr:acetylornithine transaminase [Cellulomonas wangsupingiae]MCC2335147.1 acetylornithine transaminase [Cellulomonas wangsupingiae]MCM0639234.1 acetylornithine transaminase [Cellulomonas wangsupingiae]UUI67004.1 acetylornithine transaminase [Cellulomonas wangsupingiae]
MLPVPTAAGSVAQWTDRYTHAVMDTFGPPQRVLVRGEGPYVWDADGTRYVDLLGGIAVNSLGHAHPTLTAAISAQLGTLGHVSNFFTSPAQVALAERLLQLAEAPEGSRVFLTSSGTEANEAALKLTRRHSAGARPRVLALEGAFHGRSMGALSLTHKAAYREPFEPLPPGVEFLPFGDTDALRAAFAEGGDQVAAMFVEPIQGEAGVRPLPPGYLALARELTSAHGALLVLDEVQSGMGRTGRWFAHQHPHVGGGVRPDVVTVAKGLGAGFPVGGVIAYGPDVATLLGRGQHGTTFGGNPVASAAALATIGVIERDGLLAHVTDLGERLRARLRSTGNPVVREVRGEGLLIAVELVRPVAAQVAADALEAGIIVNACTPTTLRLAPPFVLTDEQVQPFVDLVAALPATLATEEPA